MIVGIDASNIRAGGGVTHLREFLAAARPEDSGVVRVIVWASRTTLAQLSDRPWMESVSLPALNGSLLRRTLWQQTQLKMLLKSAKCDILFVPGGNYRGRFRPFATMSRSLLPFDTRERQRYGLSWTRFRLWLLSRSQTATFRRADGVIFLSRGARTIVERATGPLPGLVQVIPHGVSRRYRGFPRPQSEITWHSAERPYKLLYVSNISPYKHQSELVEAVGRLREEGFPVRLDLVGPATRRHVRPLLALISRIDPSGIFIRYAGTASNGELAEWYRDADGFVFASSCETISNTLLEAMASGLPVACSERDPMPEILGSGGVYFDPESVDDIYKTLRQFLAEKTLREECARRSYERASEFSWFACADSTFAFLASILESRPSRGRLPIPTMR